MGLKDVGLKKLVFKDVDLKKVAGHGTGFVSEFKEFLKKYQVLGLAVAFVIGLASTKLITAIVNDLVMPIIGVLVPGGDWRASVLQIGSAKFLIGDFVGAVIDFVIIALVVFFMIKLIMKEDPVQKK